METAKMYNTEFTIDAKTLDIVHNGAKCRQWLNKSLSRWYVEWKDSNGKRHMTTRARIICQAFHPVKDPSNLQADHIDSNTLNDSPSNLQWLTRKQNNSKDHAMQMKKKNGKSTSHRGEVIEATKDGMTMHFANGREAAEELGCSHVLVYNVLNEKHFAKTAKGWKLEWTKSQHADETKTSRAEDLEERKDEMTLKTAEKKLSKAKEKTKTWKSHMDKIDQQLEEIRSAAQLRVKRAEAEEAAAQALYDAVKQMEKED